MMQSDGYNHGHWYFRLRFARLAAILSLLHLPYGWLMQSGPLPHDPECTPTEGVVRS